MSLPARERRRLNGIQGALDRSDPRLASLFATFSRLTREEDMPPVERLRVRADRFAARGKYMKRAVLGRLRLILIAPVALAATAGALLIGGWSSGGPGACKAAPAMAHSSHGGTPGRSRLAALCQSTSWRAGTLAGR
ncbi:MAG TPA: hypothetical protein VKD26_03400 [Streptosporangiaceae bacterium]|nr:hypothetical protein [Streptosporangiaceae bacterium]